MPAIERNGETFTYAQPRTIRGPEDCYFYHTLDLPEYGLVKGEWDLRGRFDDYIGGLDLRGKTVLDVGTASGFLTFEAEKRGAEVVSFDISDAKYQHLLPFKDSLYYRDHAEWRERQTAGFDQWKNGYWLAHRLLGSRAKCFYGNIYDLPSEVGAFDVVIIGSVVEHLSDQVSALGSVAKLAKDTIVIVTWLLERDDKYAQFLPSADRPEHNYTWWAYSLGIYRDVFSMLGFELESVTKNRYQFNLAGEAHERYTMIARRT
jgi:SAM-dependent methyltransferase